MGFQSFEELLPSIRTQEDLDLMVQANCRPGDSTRLPQSPSTLSARARQIWISSSNTRIRSSSSSSSIRHTSSRAAATRPRRLKSITIVYSSFTLRTFATFPPTLPKRGTPSNSWSSVAGVSIFPRFLPRWTRSSSVAGRWSNLIAFLINRELQRSRRPLAKPISNRRSVSLFNFLEVDGGQGCPSASLVLEQSREA
jgi:hypothetical protein